MRHMLMRTFRLTRTIGLIELIGHLLSPVVAHISVGISALIVFGIVSLFVASSSVKARTTESRLSPIITNLGTLQSQRGLTSAFSNLSQLETGSPQPGGPVVQSGIPNNNTTSGASAGTAHTHGMQNHTHPYDHLHFTQIDGDYNTLVSKLNTMRTALINAGIL